MTSPPIYSIHMQLIESPLVYFLITHRKHYVSLWQKWIK